MERNIVAYLQKEAVLDSFCFIVALWSTLGGSAVEGVACTGSSRVLSGPCTSFQGLCRIEPTLLMLLLSCFINTPQSEKKKKKCYGRPPPTEKTSAAWTRRSRVPRVSSGGMDGSVLLHSFLSYPEGPISPLSAAALCLWPACELRGQSRRAVELPRPPRWSGGGCWSRTRDEEVVFGCVPSDVHELHPFSSLGY